MMKGLVIGSCTSGSVMEQLLNLGPDIQLLRTYPHIRSDFLLQAMQKPNSVGLSESNIELISHEQGPQLAEGPRRRLKRKLNANSFNNLQQLMADISECDFVLMDNEYDLKSPLHELRFDDNTVLTSNLELLEHQDNIKRIPLIDQEFFGTTIQEVAKEMFLINPKLKMFLFGVPLSNFRRLSAPALKAREPRALAYHDQIQRVVNSQEIENMTYFGCLELPDELALDKGPFYFSADAYSVFASKVIELLTENSSRSMALTEFSSLQRGARSRQPSLNSRPKHPYSGLPHRQYWSSSVAEQYPLSISELYDPKFIIKTSDNIATCGSCFAQHIGHRLKQRGYNFMDMEPQPLEMYTSEARLHGYGMFSARYGNVYTSRQLLQLFDRAFGDLTIGEVWTDSFGRYFDPFRPNICGKGFESIETLNQDRDGHLSSVKQMFESLDVLVVTLGLTETWENRRTGAVYPSAPGVRGIGTYEPESHQLLNLDYETILTEMKSFFSRLHKVNPEARVLVTVSPVPLAATAEDRHVLISTMASKSILRTVADKLNRDHDYVDYFPSFDIVMSPPYRSMFFKSDLREIHDHGVDYVLSHFFAAHGDDHVSTSNATHSESPELDGHSISELSQETETFCDEVFIDLERKMLRNSE